MARLKDKSKVISIFEASLKLILTEGFSGLKMGQVAKAAGLATGTLYVYFKSKESLINELYLYVKRNSMDRLLVRYSESDPFVESFEQIWYKYLEYNILHPEEGAFIDQFYRSPYANVEALQERDHLLKPIFLLLERGKKERLLNELPTALLASQLIGGIKEIARWHHNERLQLDKEAKEAAFMMAWNSVKR